MSKDQNRTAPLVTVCLATYNHICYLRQCLDSIFSQKVNFPYEVLIHDNASSDGTQDMIREYAAQYPDRVRTMLQQVNQQSQGIKSFYTLMRNARGTYIALIEGDDYWTDPQKLQKQADYMEQHPGCTLCVHAAVTVDGENHVLQKILRPAECSRDLTAQEVIGKSGWFATASMVLRRNAVQQLPNFYFHAPVGDYPLSAHLAMNGSVHYIDAFMSAYRINISGSWTSTVCGSRKKYRQHMEEMNKMFAEIDSETDGQYHETLSGVLLKREFDLAVLNDDLKTIRQEKYAEIYRTLPAVQKRRILLWGHFPRLHKFLLRLTGRD